MVRWLFAAAGSELSVSSRYIRRAWAQSSGPTSGSSEVQEQEQEAVAGSGCALLTEEESGDAPCSRSTTSSKGAPDYSDKTRGKRRQEKIENTISSNILQI
jgi:hypothetical protein